CGCSFRRPSVLVVRSGDPARRTGGNLYDARVVRAMRRRHVTVGVVSVRSASGLRRAIASARPRLVILDSIAFGAAATLVERIDTRVIALVHMRLAGPAARAVVSRADRT